MSKIPERDWKKLRALKDEKLGKACGNIMVEIEKIIKKREGKEYASYQEIWKLLTKEDEKIATMFDDQRRSTAILKIAALRRHGYLSDEEMKEFSSETQEKIKIIIREL